MPLIFIAVVAFFAFTLFLLYLRNFTASLISLNFVISTPNSVFVDVLYEGLFVHFGVRPVPCLIDYCCFVGDALCIHDSFIKPVGSRFVITILKWDTVLLRLVLYHYFNTPSFCELYSVRYKVHQHLCNSLLVCQNELWKRSIGRIS